MRDAGHRLPAGSVPEVIDDGITGFVVESEPAAADAVPKMIDLDRPRIRAEFERRYSASRMAEDYLAVYRRLIRQKETGRRAVELTAVGGR